jgi:signal transduction histidine kinase
MLKFSKESELNYKSCDFNRLVESTVESLQITAEEKGVSISVRADEQMRLVDIDSDRIQDVIFNLVLNAIEASAVDVGAVNITTGLEPGEEQFMFEVSDNGPGVEDTESIFLPFHSAKPKIGTGLGLAIAKKIVEQHGGTIGVQSKSGEGAKFHVSLPTKRTK